MSNDVYYISNTNGTWTVSPKWAASWSNVTYASVESNYNYPEELMAKLGIEKDEQGYSKIPAEGLDLTKYNTLLADLHDLRDSVKRSNIEVEIMRTAMATLLPRGLPSRCGRCKQKWYSLNMHEWVKQGCYCPNCGSRMNSNISLVPSDDNTSVLNVLGPAAAQLVRAFLADEEFRENKNETLQGIVERLQSYLYETGFMKKE